MPIVKLMKNILERSSILYTTVATTTAKKMVSIDAFTLRQNGFAMNKANTTRRNNKQSFRLCYAYNIIYLVYMYKYLYNGNGVHSIVVIYPLSRC